MFIRVILFCFPFFFFSSKMHFTIFSDFFGDFDPPWRMLFFFPKKTSSGSVCIVMKHNNAKRRFPSLKNQGAKMILRVNYCLGSSKSPTHCSSTLAGVSYNSLVRLAERKKCHGRLPLVHTIMSICLINSVETLGVLTIYGLNTNYIDFTIRRLNP